MVDAGLHQIGAQPCPTARGGNRNRTEEQCWLPADGDGPQPHRTDDPSVLTRDKADSHTRPLPQPFRRLGEAAGAEGGQNQSLDRRCIGGGFGLDAPGGFPGRVSGGGVGHERAQLGLAVP